MASCDGSRDKTLINIINDSKPGAGISQAPSVASSGVSSSDILNSVAQDNEQRRKDGGIIGAGSGEAVFTTFEKTLKWILDTQKKLPTTSEISPETREAVFNLDPLVKGIISPFLKNVILGSYAIVTKDNKKYSELVTAIQNFITAIKLIEAYREDFDDCHIKHGHSYRRKDRDAGKLVWLQRLEPGSIRQYEDAWDSRIRALHQCIRIKDAWSTISSNFTMHNSWFIPDGKKIIELDNFEENGARDIWNKYVEKYKINETENLRVGAIEDVIIMDKVRYGEPAPIDNIVLAIWLKRLLLANGPNYIFNIISPFIQVVTGKLIEVTTDTGEKKIISSVPEQPNSGDATINPEMYNQMLSIYNNWVEARKEEIKNINRYRAEGGVIGTGPDTTMNVIESGRSIQAAFIQMMISLLNEDIGQGLGFPVSLIMARGAELATTRTIAELFNTAYSGSKLEYEQIADALIKEAFDGVTFAYNITLKNGEQESGTYTIKDAQPKFMLGQGDIKDALKTAQTELTVMQALQIAKLIGASKADIQALADERGFGILDLDKFDTVQEPSGWPMGADVSSADSAGKNDLKPEHTPEDAKLQATLLNLYHQAGKDIINLLDTAQ